MDKDDASKSGASSAPRYLTKAERLLRWSRITLAEMRSHASIGKVDDVERSFYALLVLISSVHEAIESAAKEPKFSAFKESMDRSRHDDALLFYLWKARDADIHGVVLKWNVDFDLNLKVLDADAANAVVQSLPGTPAQVYPFNALLQYAFEAESFQAALRRASKGELPKPERLQQAGLELESADFFLSLLPFPCKIKGKQVQVPAPTVHEAKPCNPLAGEAAELAITFYDGRLAALCAIS